MAQLFRESFWKQDQETDRLIRHNKPAAVLYAISEYDQLGRERFLRKYGFGRAQSYWLVHDGKRYDSKAILGAAHGFARPDLGPLRSVDFSGGETTVKRKLEELGFTVSSNR